MVASSNGDLYSPFSHMPSMEEGVQSSEEGSVLHSPIYDPPYATSGGTYTLSGIGSPDVHMHDWREKGRYPDHLGHFDCDGQLLPPSSTFDARYTVPTMDPQARDPHFLETLQVPSPTTIHHHLSPTHPSTELALHHGHPMLDMGGPSSRLQSAVGPSASDYSMHLSQARLPEQQLRMSSDTLPSLPSRHSVGMPSSQSKPQISLPSASGPARNTPSESPSSQSRPPRREASTVVIACRQCRARKIRCDSTRPFCHNCLRRNNECVYDAVPKRRGPDKRPGTRQRSCKKRPADAEPASASAKKKRKTTAEGESGMLSFDVKVKENVTGGARSAHFPSRGAMDDLNATHMPPHGALYINTSIPPRGTGSDVIYPKDELSPSFRRSSVIMNFPDSETSFARPIDVNVSRLQPDAHDNPPFVSNSPPSNYGPASWWDELLDQYSPSGPEQSFQDIISDITFLFSTNSYWLSFVCLPILIRDLRDPTQRGRLQPFIMSALAMAMLMKSSELECGRNGRDLALSFHDRAKASLESACRNQTFDYTHAEAALMQALFETSAHPLYSPQRATNALELLDKIIHILSLTSMDRDDPSASYFHQRSAPIVDVVDGYQRPTQCACAGYLFAPTSSAEPKYLSQSYSPPWDPQATEEDIRKEECRRLCWCALTLVSAYTAQCSAFHTEPLELTLADSANYVLLFPGEAYERVTNHQQASGQSPKESVWALYCRSMLLWNSSSSIQRDDTLSAEDRARFAIDVFHETRDIQDALDMHKCNMDTGLAYICREYLYDTRMTITYELRRLQDGDVPALPPMFNRRQAEEWLFYQQQVARRACQSINQLREPEGFLFARRPFQVTWFANQVAIALGLWEYDHGLMNALRLARQFLVPLDVLNAIWPCPAQALQRDELRRRLHNACVAAGQPPPSPVQMHLPAMLQTRATQ